MNKFVSLIKNDESGSILIEATIFLLIFIPMFLGFIEISSYIRVKEKMARAAQEVSHILGTMSHYDQGEFSSIAVRVSQIIAHPHGVTVAVSACNMGGSASSPTIVGSTIYIPDANTGIGKCGWGGEVDPEETVEVAIPDCSDSTASGGIISEKQYVSVSTVCHYAPVFGFSKKFVGSSVRAEYSFPFKGDLVLN